MPTYTNPKTGKKIHSNTPLTDAQLEEAFGNIGGGEVGNQPVGQSLTLGRKGRSIVDDIQEFLSNTPAAPFAHPKELVEDTKAVLSPEYSKGLDPEEQMARGEVPLDPTVRMGVDIAKSFGSGLSDRYHYFADQPQEGEPTDLAGKVLKYSSPAGFIGSNNKLKGILATIPVLGDAMVAGDRALAPGTSSNDQRAGLSALAGQIASLGLMKAMSPANESVPRGLSRGLYQRYLGDNPLAEEAAPIAEKNKLVAGTRDGFNAQVEGLKNAANTQLENVKSSFGPTETVSKQPTLKALDDLSESQVLKDPGETTGPTFKPETMAAAGETRGILEQTTPPPALVQQMKQTLAQKGWQLTDEEVSHLLRNRMSIAKAIQAKQQLQSIAARGKAYAPAVLPPDVSAATEAAETGAGALRKTLHDYSPELGSADQKVSDLITLNDAAQKSRFASMGFRPSGDIGFSLRKLVNNLLMSGTPVTTGTARILSDIADALASGQGQALVGTGMADRYESHQR